MAGAAFRVDRSFTDDETIELSFEWKMKDGSDFPWAEYDIAYSLVGCGQTIALTLDNGISVNEELNAFIVEPGIGRRLRPGQYRHGVRITHLETGKVIQPVDGTVTITEGNFR